jgi:membrane-associated phospholipid phosphatase
MRAPCAPAGSWPIDRLLLAYLAVDSAVVVARIGHRPAGWWLLAAHALAIVLIMLLTRNALGRAGRIVRELYPLILLLGLYAELDVINSGGGAAMHDLVVQRWEHAIFGGQPSRDWWQAYPSAFWSTLLHAAYLSYYFIVAVPAMIFAVRRDVRALRHFLFSVLAAFVACYVFFLLFPVAGPYYAFPRPTGPFVGNVAARMVYATLGAGSSYGAAFPSSHVAASVAAAGAAYRADRRLGLILAVPTVLLTVSVVYCQMHYAVDAIAGLIVGVAALAVGRVVEG